MLKPVRQAFPGQFKGWQGENRNGCKASLGCPNHEFRSVPIRQANAELRTKEYVTPVEVEKLIKTAKDGRDGHRDATLVLIAFRHGLRASEICDLE
jgi:hypothetical protein